LPPGIAAGIGPAHRRAGQASRAIDNAVAVGLAAVMLASMKNRLRTLVYEKLMEADGRKMHPVVRHLRNAASIVNELLPDGIRMDARAAPDAAAPEPRPAAAAGHGGGATAAAPARPAQAPVFVYFDGRDHRTKAKIEELLTGQKIAFKVLDVTDDEAEKSWVTTAAQTNELPIVVIAGTPIGGLGELTQLNLSGELQRRVFGAGTPSS
jgi:glutaredoxin